MLDELGRGVIGGDVDNPSSTSSLNIDSLEDALRVAHAFPVRHRDPCDDLCRARRPVAAFLLFNFCVERILESLCLQFISAEGDSLRQSGEGILRIRRALHERDWATVERLVGELEAAGRAVHSAVTSELHAAHSHVENWRVVDALTRGLVNGGVRACDDGGVDVSGVATRELLAAVALSESVGHQSQVADSMTATARHVIDMRNCVLHGDWAGARSAVQVRQLIVGQLGCRFREVAACVIGVAGVQ